MSNYLRQRGLLAAVAVGALLALAGCGGSSTGSPGSANAAATSVPTGSAHVTIGFSESIAANPNNKAIDEGAAVQAKALGMGFDLTDANLDLSKQMSDIASLRQKGVNALLTSPLDQNSMRPTLSKVHAQIPVITWAAAGPYSTVDFESTDYEAAKQAAEFIAQKVGRGASVAAIEGLPQIPILAARNQGFLAGAKAAGLKVVATQVNTKDNAAGAQPIVTGWKAKYGTGLKAIWAYNDPSALGAASAKDAAFHPVVTGMNGEPDAVEAIKQGLIDATWDQEAPEIGNGEAWAAYQILVKKKKLPGTVYVPMQMIDKSNAGDWISIKQRVQSPMTVAIKHIDGRPTLVTHLAR